MRADPTRPAGGLQVIITAGVNMDAKLILTDSADGTGASFELYNDGSATVTITSRIFKQATSQPTQPLKMRCRMVPPKSAEPHAPPQPAQQIWTVLRHAGPDHPGFVVN